MGARSNMIRKKTAKKKITTTSTHLQETQRVVVREPGAIGKPVEKINLHLGRRLYRHTRRIVALHESRLG
jgi:hypothetical protein